MTKSLLGKTFAFEFYIIIKLILKSVRMPTNPSMKHIYKCYRIGCRRFINAKGRSQMFIRRIPMLQDIHK